MSILFAILKLWWDWSEKTNQETAIGVTFNQKFIFDSYVKTLCTKAVIRIFLSFKDIKLSWCK